MNDRDIGGIVVTRPRILATRRHDAATFSVGDEAVVAFDPGLLQFLMLRDEAGTALGEGGAFAWTVPVGAAGTAAYAAVEPPALDGLNAFSGVSNVVHWQRACRPDETLIASCRIAAIGRTVRLPYRVFSSQRADLVVEGAFVFVSVTVDGEGRYAMDPRRSRDTAVSPRGPAPVRAPARRPAAPQVRDDDIAALPAWSHLPVWSDGAPPAGEGAEPAGEPLFAIRPPRVLRRSAPAGTRGAVWEWLFPRDLLRLLGHPIAGGAEPLGRRHHPFGRILEGMGVHAALAIAGSAAPRTLEVEWWAPTTGDEHFRLRSTLVSREGAAAQSTHDVYEGERPVGTVRVTTDDGGAR